MPRYTSYPTAPHFDAAIGPDIHAGWLAQAGRSGEPVSIYLHIPFCRTICNYCGCTTRASRGDDPIRAYAALLRREIALVAERLGRVEVAHIHWGGGTLSLLPPDWFEAIVADLADAFRFRTDMEHAIEIDPRHLTPDGARHLARLGINRASLGVQTLDPAVQVAIRRVQPLSVVAGAAAMLRAAGIDVLNFDLMYGLPFQNLDSVQDTARQVLALRPDRLALFGYAHVPWLKSHQKLIDPASLPGGGERLRQANAAREILEDSGYRGIGIDHFALPDDPLTEALANHRLHRNFQGYTTDNAATVIGFGASAIGRTTGGFVQNAADNHGWRRAIEARRLPTVRGKAFAGDDRLRADVIEQLLCYFAVDLGTVAARHDALPSIFDDALTRLAPLVEAGWVGIDHARVVIRRHRQELARLATSAFDAYLARGGGRHSLAV
ncbi:oxygen-independent coproporphyrinogen III oxidase [Geminicoccus harenae]|uniref:oxygen-independent coproporphyrinogen III oxidase n=1 Tax=Geminicoccus harenae TaxID=2498453 RepID=UPI001C96DA70|nr:oxygen-independent coproporphyrinogen III oxidase [Geminicoccus harenae]